VSAESHVQQTPESPAVSTRGVAWSAFGALVLLAGTIGVLQAIYRSSVPVKAPPPPQKFSQPRVDTEEVEELHRTRAAQSNQLETWRWANDQHTLVQIPIERAMQLLTQKGGDAYAPLLPQQPALSSPTAGAQRVITPGETPNAATAPKDPAPPQENKP
jgi:hypothetical protein